MKSKNIKFARELCFNAVLDNAEGCIKPGLIDFQVPKGDLLLRMSENEFASTNITAEESAVLSELHNSYGRSLLRVDKVDDDHLAMALLCFSDAMLYDDENPLRIVVDQAIASDLGVNNINQEDAVKELEKQIVVDEYSRFCFAYSRSNESKSLEIIGERYTFVVAETPQHYLHIVQMRRRTNRGRIDSPIVLIKGCIEIVDELTDRAILTQRTDEQYQKLISSDTEFINLWNVYNELEIESIRQQASEMGFLKYKSFRYSNGTIFFALDGMYTRREFCVDNMYYVAIPNINPESPIDYNFRSATVIGTEIDYGCVNSSEFRIKEDMDTTRVIPSKGYLLPSVSGSEIQKKRRTIAEKRIISNDCQLPGLKNILQGGVQVGVSERKREPISSNLEREIFERKDRHFTEKQKQAINVAINTPDIAIIQGPPGTGKTTIIKAIVKRIDELWNSKAKILITSTQHDAVDNAVEEINYGGVPVNRVAVRKGKETENWLIYDWIDNMISSCEGWLESNGSSIRGNVREIFEKLLKAEEASSWDEKYYRLVECQPLMETLSLSAEILRKFSKTTAELCAKLSNNESSEENELRSLVNGQRLTKEAYLDDGIVQLKQLERYLKFNSEIDFDIPSYWPKLKHISDDVPELDQYLCQLQGDCIKLEMVCGESKVDDTLLERDVKELIRNIRLEVVALGDDKSSMLGNLVWEFKQELTNANNVGQLIKSYSRINAATCQQAANPRLSELTMRGFDEKYDYVIVDEAARSNPLDLLIPMSMGRKIILVGDHKQLPHMVERNVVEAVARKTEGKNVESVLEESLFMRLNALVAAEDKKLGISRTAMLSEQYRMHPDICELVNVFYGNLKTLCKREDKEHNLGLYDNKALAWIDMPLCDQYPAEVKIQSISRKCEVDRIREELAKILLKNNKYSIGIITFYSAQAKLLNDMVQSEFPDEIGRIRVGTVDAFQGKEFDIVLLSIVRANEETEMRKRVGFLDNNNRLCVAFSRAKRLLVTVGDAKTVAFDGNKEYVKALNAMYQKCQ